MISSRNVTLLCIVLHYLMITHLPDSILAIIFSYLPNAERICTLAIVCEKWYEIIHCTTVWKKVDFDFQRKVTPDVLRKYGYPGTREILLSECCYLKWGNLCSILSQCKRIDVFIAPWIGHKKEVVPDFTQTLKIGCLPSALFGFESLQSYGLVYRASYKMPSFKSSLSSRLPRD
ncbi:hypothetical protein ACROYT_G014791 [Oculina patagonica]